jgi:hypothetical protein
VARDRVRGIPAVADPGAGLLLPIQAQALDERDVFVVFNGRTSPVSRSAS